MPSIKIRNFGPIKAGYEENDGFLDISRVTLFIGNQGSGKSTIAKLISTFFWMEKALMRGDYSKDDFTAEKFLNERLVYHRLSKEYYKNNPELVFKGNAYNITFKDGKLQIEKQNGAYTPPQIMYIPAERSSVASVGNAAKLKNISEALNEFITEYGNAKESISDPLKLPLDGVFAEYDKTKDKIYIRGNDYRISLTDAASGFQSLVPSYLVSFYLCNSVKTKKNGESMSSDEKRRFNKEVDEINNDPNLNDEQKRIMRSKLGKKYNKAAFINIVEEPELNLFPSAQKKFLYDLLKFNNTVSENETEPRNMLIMTTHSPYFINYLNIAIYGENINKKMSFNNRITEKELFSIIPKDVLIDGSDVSIYQLDEKKGVIIKLPALYGIPSDNNLLNNLLQDGNDEFDKLLDIEEKLSC